MSDFDSLKTHYTKAVPPDAELPNNQKPLTDGYLELPYDNKSPLWDTPLSMIAGVDGSACMSLMPPAQRMFFWSFIYGLNPKTYLEIGSATGGSANIVMTAMKALGSKDFQGVCIDPKFEFPKPLRAALQDNFLLIEEFSSLSAMKKAREAVGDLFDVILVDGDHTYDYALADILLVIPFIKPGGYLLVDDAGYFQVRDAIQYTLENTNLLDAGFISRHLTKYDMHHQIETDGPWKGEEPYMSGMYLLRKPLLNA